jgi:hypothetical protein
MPSLPEPPQERDLAPLGAAWIAYSRWKTEAGAVAMAWRFGYLGEPVRNPWQRFAVQTLSLPPAGNEQ